jgi:MraZ protein
MAFRGEHAHAIDAKGRTSLPARFRELISAQKETSLIVTRDPWDGCLLGYPLPEWKRLEEKLDALPQFSEDVLNLKRVLVAPAHEVDIDGMGRVLIPQSLRDYADLAKEVVWVGQVRTLQLWSQERWKKVQAQAIEEIAKAPVAARLRALL